MEASFDKPPLNNIVSLYLSCLQNSNMINNHLIYEIFKFHYFKIIHKINIEFSNQNIFQLNFFFFLSISIFYNIIFNELIIDNRTSHHINDLLGVLQL